MTLNDLLKKIPEDKRDCNLTISKHDEGQVSACTTVSVDSAHLGFDWTHGQIVLEPLVRLVTYPGVVKNAHTDALEYFSARVTKAMRIASEISRLIEDMEDNELKMKIRNKLAEI